ncbi:oligosaccharide flippase family protein [Aeromonas veronii]|jgi:O-antigen/teichoic acid export membrane protein|uniref:Sugar translocase n=1 Tax=Aeromonas veronii TaxID=654 RepID=A0A2T4N3V5_AERVE|nr:MULTISPECIES: oligosaccharide flippase family protein [Aeromonas]HDN9000812.1 oligosaccharide flippase family protein [Aeromonas veronii AMC24]AXV19231.1 sugar translocase [Aeromonas veronii]AYV37192.1 sugar translocase [Aeromonas veronii]KAE9624589.1 oligosaccharide flippase family protein [Aeromonas veronii]KRV64214.1 sugar translocase [Aeromonas veronii]
MKLGVNQIAMLYYAGGLLLMKGISLLMLPVLTHQLLPREYGQLEVLLTLINLGSLILGFGLVDALYRFAGLAKDEQERQQVVARMFGLVWLIALASLVLLWLLAPVVQAWLPVETRLADVRWVLCALPFEGVIGVPLAWLRMRNQARLFFVATAGKAVIQSVLTGWWLWLGWGVSGVLASGTLTCVALALLLSLWQWRDSGIRFDWQHYRPLLRYGLPLVVSGLAGFALSGLDRWLLADVVGEALLAYYAVAGKLALAVGLLLQPFALWWYPRRFMLLREPDGLRLNAHYSVMGSVLGFVTAGIVGLTAPLLIRWLTPESYHGAIAYIPLLVLGMAVRNVSDLLNVGCFSGEKSNAQMVINLGCSALGVAGFLLAIPPFGVAGVIWTLLLVYLVRALAFYLVSQRLLPLPYRLSTLWASSLGALAMVWLGQWWAGSWLV